MFNQYFMSKDKSSSLKSLALVVQQRKNKVPDKNAAKISQDKQSW